MTATYDPIATTTLGSAASTITFSSIPSTYTDLRAVVIGTSTSSFDTLRFRLNSDTGANYSATWIYGQGTSAVSARSTGDTFGNAGAWTGFQTSTPTFVTIDLFSYAGSTNKTALTASSDDLNGSGSVARNVVLWRNTSTVNTITFSLNSNFAAGTTATLYGIKAE